MNSQTWLIPIPFIFFILTNISTFITAQSPPLNHCFNNDNYTNNSIYSNNLNTILSSLSSDMSPQGFLNVSMGQTPDRVNVIALCRPDTQPDECRSCIQSATVELVNSCPYRRRAIQWRQLCTLRYSNNSIIGNLNDSPSYFVYAVNSARDPQQFSQDLTTLLGQIRGQAAAGGSLMKAAAGDRTSLDFQTTIYMLLQCSPDISPDDCIRCLNSAAQSTVGCCGNSTSMNVLQPSCILRYDTGLFYNSTRIQEAQALPVGPHLTPPSPGPDSSPPIRLSPPGNGNNNTTRTVIIIVVVIIVSLAVVACVGIFMIKRRKHKADENIEPNEEMSTEESLQYDFGKIRAATNDFSDSSKLGQGGFGAVYKGKLQNGQEIAVKRLAKGSSQGNIEFKNEIILMARLQHRNLVRLLGFALEGTERLLVYEFVENASLDHFIFDLVRRSHIDWDRRYKIIGGIAKGLLYLHEDSRLRIIHRDLKAGNILLDAEMNPKIADFGTARLFEPDESRAMTRRIVGTYGYMAPEYVRQGQFSVRSDVFSYGVLVLEIISGQKNNSFQNGDNLENMLSFAWRN